MRTLKWSIAFALLIATTCIAVYFWFHYVQCRRLETRLRDVPVRMAADLSTPGVYTGTFEQTSVPSEGGGLYIEPASGNQAASIRAADLTGLACLISFRDGAGKVVLRHRHGGNSLCSYTTESGTTAYGLRIPSMSMPKGTYTLDIDVQAGAPALASVPYEVVGRYNLFTYPIVGMYLLAIAVVSSVVSLGIGWGMLAIRGRRRRRLVATGKCVRCEYDLTGNVSGVCPECGTACDASPALATGPRFGDES